MNGSYGSYLHLHLVQVLGGCAPLHMLQLERSYHLHIAEPEIVEEVRDHFNSDKVVNAILISIKMKEENMHKNIQASCNYERM